MLKQKQLFLVLCLCMVTWFISGDGRLTAQSQPEPVTTPFAPDIPSSNHALSLDGSGDYVEIPHNTALNPTSAFTVEAWVNYGGSTACQTIKIQVVPFPRVAERLVIIHGLVHGYPGILVGAVQWQNPFLWRWFSQLRRWQCRDSRRRLDPYCRRLAGQRSPILYQRRARLPGRVRIGANRQHPPRAHWPGQCQLLPLLCLDGPLPGLVANWRFSTFGDDDDNIGGFNGTAFGNATTVSGLTPAQPAYTPVDTNFNSVSLSISQAAAVYLPEDDQKTGR